MRNISRNKDKIECNRCGKCCIVYDDVENNWKPCPYLLHYIDDKTRCMIFPHRIGVWIGKEQLCIQRMRSPYNYPGCPYNEDNKKMHPAYE